MPTAEYFAGHFDGEGCVTMSRHNKGWRVEAKVNVSFPRVLDAYKSQFGGLIYPVAKTRNKRMWLWKLHNHAQLLAFLEAIEPFSMEKSPQIAIALQWLRLRQTFPSNRVPYEFIAYGNICAAQLHKLKLVSY